MSIKHWPAEERPREKLLQRGANALSDAELLAIFLRTGLPGRSAVDLARELLGEFGSLAQLLSADQQAFCRGAGLGVAKYAQLQAVIELARRYLGEEIRRDSIFTSPQSVSEYLISHLGHATQEIFAVLFLDTQHRLIVMEELFRGTIDGASVYPREVVKRALHHNASAVVLAHNHPSGVAEPSISDREITETLKKSLALVDVRMLDHIVVAAGRTVSMAQLGLV